MVNWMHQVKLVGLDKPKEETKITHIMVPLSMTHLKELAYLRTETFSKVNSETVYNMEKCLETTLVSKLFAIITISQCRNGQFFN